MELDVEDRASPPAAAALTPGQRRKAIFAATLGNGLEFYDFVTFAFFAIQIGRTGGTDVLEYVDLPTPSPGPGEVLVKATAIGVTLLALAAMFQMADAAQVMALGLLRGIKDTRVPMWAAAISYWGIGIPVSYALGFVLGWGGVGVWLGLSAGLAFASGSMMIRFEKQSDSPTT